MADYTKDDLDRMLTAARSRYENMKNKMEHSVKKGVAVAEITGGAFLGGAVRGYFDNPAIWGIPVDLAAGVALIGVGLFTDEAWGDDAINLGSGLTASFSTAMGAKMGAQLAGKKTTAGHDPYQLSAGAYPGNQSIADMMAAAHG